MEEKQGKGAHHIINIEETQLRIYQFEFVFERVKNANDEKYKYITIMLEVKKRKDGGAISTVEPQNRIYQRHKVDAQSTMSSFVYNVAILGNAFFQ